MRGQWVGNFSGSVEGRVIVNCDEVDGNACLELMIDPDSPALPKSIAEFEVFESKFPSRVKAKIYPIHPDTFNLVEWHRIRDRFGKDVVHAEFADVEINIQGGDLSLHALTDVGSEFNATLHRYDQLDKSRVSGEIVTWQDFKEKISGTAGGSFVYRGQQEPWPLRSSFHRSGRFRLSNFLFKDVRELHRRLSALTRHYFDLNDPEQNGAFLNLLQHHGYPTPLLDWTYSPYVAAFFAFRKIKLRSPEADTGVVRIYVFDLSGWLRNVTYQVNFLNPPFPHVSTLEFISLENPRVVPQQAMITSSNLEDIEGYIQKVETITETKFLKAYDIPVREASIAMRDLAFMGITAGSIFPGIDGVCEEFKERNFDV